ncbi:hypothetical protein CTI12_AA161560 [Artemisia annua]|uniref:Defective in cullin neddylation protein n=1 Tax=Artemisia annua TaxID=35608 RepID=A0A2U1MQA6_ARTAN|nr:hypothetical protein CTI12_AA161560 [Artemisia annua]
MSDENLANSMVIYIEKEIADKFDAESIIEEFKGLKGCDVCRQVYKPEYILLSKRMVWMSILEEVVVLMSRLNLQAYINEFSRFYDFVFFICRENGQRSITVSRAIMAWKLVLSGRFRLFNQWCIFVEQHAGIPTRFLTILA